MTKRIHSLLEHSTLQEFVASCWKLPSQAIDEDTP